MDISYIFTGFGVGLLVGLTGVGGGALMTPLLILVYHVQPLLAIGTDLLFAAITKSVGTIAHGSQSTIEWRVVFLLASGSIPATIVSLVILSHLQEDIEQLNSLLGTILGFALVLTAVSIFFRNHLLRFIEGFSSPTRKRNLQPILTIAGGALLGSMVTFSSIGAGALGVMIISLIYPRLTLSRVVGSDIAHAVPLTAIAGMGHMSLGNTDFTLLALLLCGSIPGVIAGSLLGKNIPEYFLRFTLAGILLLTGIKLVG